MRRSFWLIGLLIVGLFSGIYGFRTDKVKNPGNRTGQAAPLTRVLWLLSGIETAPLHIKVVDEVTMKGVPGAGCVVADTNQRVETDANGVAPVIRAPVLRDPRKDELTSVMAGELTVICYKKGYRDSVYTGVRMYKDTATQFEHRMTPYSENDKRIEPTYRHVEPHRLWKIDLADHYRLFDQGQGNESPNLTRPGNLVVPQHPLGGGLQTPVRPGLPGQPEVPPPPAP